MSIWRLVYEQSGRESVSTVVLAEEEVSEQIKCEASLHLFAGWKVELLGDGIDGMCDPLFDGGDVTGAVMVSPRNVIRRVWARAYDPAEDGGAL